MKKLTLLTIMSALTLLSFANGTAKVAPAAKPTSDSTFIYIYRVGQFGGALSNFSIFLDGKKLCKISNNKYFRIAVTPGTHSVTSKVGGMSVMKKEMETEIVAEKGGEYYISCNMKQSFTRVRLELTEVTKNTGKKQLEGMSEDKCQEKLDKDAE